MDIRLNLIVFTIGVTMFAFGFVLGWINAGI